MRYKKQIFNINDLNYIGFSSHMLESAFKKKHFLTFFDREPEEIDSYDDFMVGEVCPNNLHHSVRVHVNIQEYVNPDYYQCSQDMLVFTYLSTNYYKPKNQFIQNPFKNETGFPHSGVQIQITGDQQDFPRDNSYLNYALNVKPSYELPSQPFDDQDAQQVIETFLEKKAKLHNRDNFGYFKLLLGQEKVESMARFSKYTYTFDDVEFIENLGGGLRPVKIQNLKPSSSVYKYFTQEVEVTTQKINFDQCEILVPKRQLIRIENKSKKRDLLIRAIMTSSPELSVYPPQGFPNKLKPMESIVYQIVYTPETYGLFEALFFVNFEEYIFVGSISAYVVANEYELEPIYITDVMITETVEYPLMIQNPLSSEQLIIQELYSTENYVELLWPNGEHLNPNIEANDGSYQFNELNLRSDYLKIPANKKAHLVTLSFQMNQTQDYYAEIHIRTSRNDIMRVPVYYHVHDDQIKFTPTIVDFGVVPLNFDMLKIVLKGKSRCREPITIQDVFVPISEQRLDFIMLDSKSMGIQNQQFKKGQEINFGYVFLTPSASGIVHSKLIIQALGYYTNTTYKIEVPIVGNVVNDSLALNLNSTNIGSELVPAMASYDVVDYLLPQTYSGMLFVIPAFRPIILQQPLIIKNTFGVPITLKGIFNQNPEVRVQVGNEYLTKMNSQGITLIPGQSIKLATVELITTNLKITSGSKYLSVLLNQTMVPISLQVQDRSLVCVWEEEQKSRFVKCTENYDINFGYVALNEPKVKRLNISNMNSYNITLETVSKSQLDDLSVYLEQIVDKNGRIVPVQDALKENREGKYGLLTGKRSKKIINLTIRPYQTLCIEFTVLAKELKQKQSTISFQTKEEETSEFSFNYQYQVIDGNLSMVPQVLRFSPGFPGMVQQRQLMARSTFDIPIVIKQIYSNDIRIFPAMQPFTTNVILPKNKSEIALITFDPSKLSNSPTIHTSILDPQQILSSVDPSLQQNFIQFLQNTGNNQIQYIVNSAQFQQGNQGQIFFGGFQNLNNQLNKNDRETVTIQDILQFKEKQKTWEKLGAMGKTEINSYLTIETNVFQNITVPIKAHLAKPSIIEEESIELEITQIGSQSFKSIKIVNPSEYPITISLFLSYEPIGGVDDFLKYDSGVEGDGRLSPYKDTYFQAYCGSKIKEILKSNDKNYTERLNNMAIDELLVNKNHNQKELCWHYQQLLKNNEQYTPEEKELIQSNMEHFFKDILHEQQVDNSQLLNLNKNIGKLKDIINKVPADKLNKNIDLSQFNLNFPQASFLGQQYSDPEIEAFIQSMNKVSNNKVIDANTITIIQNIEKSRSLGIIETLYQIQQHIRSNKIPQKTPQQRQAAQAKKEQKVQKKYKLANQILNDLIIFNDTLRYQSLDYYDSNSVKQSFMLPNQSFYINPQIVGKSQRIEPKSNYTIHNAIIFQPQSLLSDQMTMYLIIKNNLTVIQQVELKGRSGSGLIEFVRILKQSHVTDEYVDAQSLIYTQQFMNIDNSLNSSDPQVQKSVRERIIAYIYGEPEQVVERRNMNPGLKKNFELEKILNFNIGILDTFYSQVPSENQQPQNVFEIPGITDQMLSKQQNLKLVTFHRRVFIAQNTGNVPILIESISLDGNGCSGFGIQIENCSSLRNLTIKPGEQQQINITYETDYTIGQLRKSLIIECKHFTQEFVLQISLPMQILPLASQMVPMSSFEETFFLVLKFAILGAGFLSLIMTSKDIMGHIKFKQDQADQEKLVEKVYQESQMKALQPPKYKELPIMSEMLANDQILGMYSQSQEKLEHPNQLLLKEISNICSKKNLVCLEVQKQALEAEKERRHHNKQQYNNAAISKYLERKEKEQFLFQQARQKQMEYEMTFQQVQAKSNEQRGQPISQTDLRLFHEDSKESDITEHTQTDTISLLQQDSHKSVTKVKEQRPKPNVEILDQQEANVSIDEQNQDQHNTAESKQESKAKPVNRLSKKQQKAIAQRIKEQQEMEERFRVREQQRIQYEEQERVRKMAEEKRLLELQQELRLQEEEEERRRQLKAEQQLLSEDRAAPSDSQTQEDVQVEFQDQSIHFEKDNTLNLSQVIANNEPSFNERIDRQGRMSTGVYQRPTEINIINLSPKKQEIFQESLFGQVPQERVQDFHQVLKDQSSLNDSQKQFEDVEDDNGSSNRKDSRSFEVISERVSSVINQDEGTKQQPQVNEIKANEQRPDQPETISTQQVCNTPQVDSRRIVREHPIQPSIRPHYYQGNMSTHTQNQNKFQPGLSKFQASNQQQQNQGSQQQYYNYQQQRRYQNYQYQGQQPTGYGRGFSAQNFQQQNYQQMKRQDQFSQQRQRFYNTASQEEEDYHERRPQPQPSQNEPARRVVTLKQQHSQTFSRDLQQQQRQKGKPNTFYRNYGQGGHEYYEEEEPEDYKDQYYYNRPSYDQSGFRKQYQRDDQYEDYQQRKYYKKPNYSSYDEYGQQEYESEGDVDDGQNRRGQRPQRYQQQYQYRQDYDQQRYQQQPIYVQRIDRSQKQSFEYKSNEEKDKTPKSHQAFKQESKEQEPNVVAPSHKAQLSKDDLQPFFESQRKTDDQQNLKQQKIQNLGSPPNLPSSSLFSFNTLGIFSQQSNQKENTIVESQENQSEQSMDYEEMIPREIVEDEEEPYSEEEKGEATPYYPTREQPTFTQNQGGTNFYNAFKSATSLFSKPLFGATSSTQEYSRQTNQHSPGKQGGYNQEYHEQPSQSLYSGSLFGEGPFAQQKRSFEKQDYNYGMRQGNSGAPQSCSNYQSSYQETQQPNQSLFGSGFGLNFKYPANQSHDQSGETDPPYYQNQEGEEEEEQDDDSQL